MNRPRVFVSGPLSSPTCTGYLQNVHRFTTVSVALRRRGFAPFDPSLDFIHGIMAGDLDYEDYFAPNMAWLEKADVVYLIDPSPGADRECGRARELGIPIVHSLKELEELLHREWVDDLPVDPDA
jgi:hypothetical protein